LPHIRGVSIVAAPIKMPDGSINALVSVGVGEQMRQCGLVRIGAALRTRAARLTRMLDGRTA
jgi:DNA-binding IclR family transcriptional regulator